MTHNQSELEQKIFSLTVETGRKFMKTRVLEDWTLSKQIMELVNAYITANYTPNSKVDEVKAKAYQKGYIDGGIAELTKE